MKKNSIDFIGIGAHKCASTWLWYNLRSHQQVWVPPQKELHYFDRSANYPSTCELSTEVFWDRVFGLSSVDALWRRKAIRNLAGSVVRLDIERIRWWLEFYPRNFNDEWYLRLFENRRVACTGEITPAYSMLEIPDIKRIVKLCPDVKIIYVIRDPIERAWSHLRFDAGLGKIKSLSDLDEVKRYIDGDALTKRGDYLATIRNWLAVVPPERFFIGFYDDIKLDSLAFLSELSAFLQIDSGGFPQQNVEANIGVSRRTSSMPSEVEAYLAHKYINDLEELTTMVNSHSLKWLQVARERLNGSSLPFR